jgi:hypothetical protein
MEQEITDVKQDLDNLENDGLAVFPTNKIIRGSLSTSDGETVDTTQTSRISTKQRLSYAKDMEAIRKKYDNTPLQKG